MTGKIKMLSGENASGFIKAENGLSVHFDSSAVLAYDATRLAVGQLVTFELESGDCSKAVNLCVQKQHPVPDAEEKRQENIRLRYMGFEQSESVRAYRFERISAGTETKTFIVTTDLALFRKHHVGIQEGPALCLHLLMGELNAAGAAHRSPLQCSLTDRDLLDYLASRPAPRTKPGSKWMPHASAAASHTS